MVQMSFGNGVLRALLLFPVPTSNDAEKLIKVMAVIMNGNYRNNNTM